MGRGTVVDINGALGKLRAERDLIENAMQALENVKQAIGVAARALDLSPNNISSLFPRFWLRLSKNFLPDTPYMPENFCSASLKNRTKSSESLLGDRSIREPSGRASESRPTSRQEKKKGPRSGRKSRLTSRRPWDRHERSHFLSTKRNLKIKRLHCLGEQFPQTAR